MKFGILEFDEPTNDLSRKIIHVDMDAFYASVEIRDNPSLKGKPVIIARHPKDTNGRGVVTTASYEARKYGVHSAMPAQKAFELCPDGIFIPGRHEYYREVSGQIRDIFRKYTDMIEPVSLDEAYLDVTENKLNINSGTIIAKKIQKDIYSELKLTSSAGVSYNKFLAKLSSDYHKPAGFTLIEPDQAHAFLTSLPIAEFHGVGEKSQEALHEMGIDTGEDLYNYDVYDLITRFGKMGILLYNRVRGVDNSQVKPNRDRKSVGKEHTFGSALYTIEQVEQEFRQLSQKVMETLKKYQLHGKTVVIKVRDTEFVTKTKRRTMPRYVNSFEELYGIVLDIWEEVGDLSDGIRLLGVTVTGLEDALFEYIELPLFDNKNS